MNPRLVYIAGTIYLKHNGKLQRIAPVQMEEDRIGKLEEKARERFQKRKEQEIEDKMQEHIAVILHELVHAVHNHPDHKWPWKSFDFIHQTAVMMEEAGEAVRAANNMRSGDENQMALYNELAQTAAMCLRIMEQIKEYSIYGETGD